MQKHAFSLEHFSLLGGPLHRVGRRVGLVRGGANTVALGLAVAGFLWGILVVLAFIEGISHQLFSLTVIGGHARLLAAIPLLFLCESVFDPRALAFVQTIVRSGVVPESARPALETEASRIVRWKDAWLPETLCLLAAVLFSLTGVQLHLSGATSALDAGHTLSDLTWTAWWYWAVCLTLFRFLMFRWLWRLGLWCYFLWRVSKLQLDLLPTHPDYAAGLGCLEIVQMQFIPLVLAISVIQSASLAGEISSGTLAFEAIYPATVFVLVVDAVLVLGPLFIFAPKLWFCRLKGLSDYMVFGSSYVSRFDRKWLGAAPPEHELLGTPDLQSMADLGNSIEVVRNMRWVPMSVRLTRDIVLAALLPILPLLLLKYPVTELAEKFFTRLAGF
jgi:hypothetical protein